jgi:uncharacterized membrane protein YbhN (UPF0104 family)
MTRPWSRAWARRGLIWLGLGVSGLFAFLAVRDVDLDEVWDALGECDYWWLAPAVVALAGGNAVRVWRWQLQFARETRPPFRRAASALLIGTFANNVLPARAGEAAQVVALRRSARASAAETVATVLLGRVWDVASVLLLLFVLLWLPDVDWLRAAAILSAVLAGALVLVAVALRAFGHRPLRWLLRPFAGLPRLTPAHTERAALDATRGLVSLREPMPALVTLGLTTVGWLVFGLSNWFVLRGFDLGLPFLAGVLVTIALTLAMVLPSSPAAVGVFEAAVLVALDAYGVSKSEGLSVALVLHAVNFFPYLLAGPICLHLEAGGFRQSGATLRAERHGPGAAASARRNPWRPRQPPPAKPR